MAYNVVTKTLRNSYGTDAPWPRQNDSGRSKSSLSLIKLARKYGINPKTVAKWKKRDGVGDLPMGPKEPRSLSLTREEEALFTFANRHSCL